TLTSSAALYNNTAGWYKAGLNTLENNKLYDYQYLAYNANGEILGGGQGGINTALNQATITQKALSVADLPSVYVDKQETVNTKQDIVYASNVNLGFIKSSIEGFGNTAVESESHFRFKYSFDNSLVVKYPKSNFKLVLKNGFTGAILKESDLFLIPETGVTSKSFDILSSEFSSLKVGGVGSFEVSLVMVSGDENINISSRIDNVNFDLKINGRIYTYYYSVVNNYGSVVLGVENLGLNNSDRPFKLRYTFENNLIKKYGGDKFAIVINDSNGSGFSRTSQIISISDLGSTTIDIELSKSEFNQIQKDNAILLDVKLVLVETNGSFIKISEGMEKVVFNTIYTGVRGQWYDYKYEVLSESSSLNLDPGFFLRLRNQSVSTKKIAVYYREFGGNAAFKLYSFFENTKDIYGQSISSIFDIDFNSVLDTTKKYEIQYIALDDKTILNRQQGIIEFNGQDVNSNF
ncbi:hypothetical protein, partial [Acinetobacter baumannii]|uniref:hypothetical protein n=1 Tax=Acinetobacter baumannii TaxID=470 RepID=UPI00339034C1